MNKTEGTLAKPAKMNALDKFRWDLQQQFVVYKLTHQISQKQMAEIIGVDEGKVSKTLRNRLDDFSTDRLIKCCERLNPKARLKVS